MTFDLVPSPDIVATAEAAGIIGLWRYDRKREAFQFSKASLSILGLAGTPERQSLAAVAGQLGNGKRKPIKSVLETGTKGDVIKLSATPRKDGGAVQLVIAAAPPGGEPGTVTGILFKADPAPGSVDPLPRGEAALRRYVGDLQRSRATLENQAQQLSDLAHRYAEERANAQEASNAKSHFLAVTSHELRTPLTGLMGMVDLLKRTALSDEQARYVDTIHRASQSLLTILNDILDFSKIEAGQLELEAIAFSVSDMLRDVVQLYTQQAADKGLELEVETADGLPPIVRGDPVRLHQVLVNLASNALKFTDDGKIVIALEGFTIAGDWIVLDFCVSDTGIGIEESEIASLFVPFKQASPSTARLYGGTGLGLTICQRLVEAMGGEITVESTPGQGSIFRFSVTFRTADEASSRTERPPMMAPADPALAQPGPGQRILLVEDNATNRTLIETMLQRNGHQVTSVETGQRAIAAARHQEFDVILLDMRLPDMSGERVCRMISKSERPDHTTRLIGLTADIQRESHQALLAAGADAVLTKPIDWIGLERCLQGKDTPSPNPGHPPEDGIAQGPPDFDRDRISELVGVLGIDIVQELLESFRQECGAALGEIDKAAAAMDQLAIKEAAHKVAGLASNIGADAVCDQARALEGFESPPPDLDQRVRALHTSYGDLETILDGLALTPPS